MMFDPPVTRCTDKQNCFCGCPFPPGLQWSNLWHAENSSNSLGEAVGSLLCCNVVECFVCDTQWLMPCIIPGSEAAIVLTCQMMVAQLLAVPFFLLLWRYLEQAWAKRIGDGRWIPQFLLAFASAPPLSCRSQRWCHMTTGAAQAGCLQYHHMNT